MLASGAAKSAQRCDNQSREVAGEHVHQVRFRTIHRTQQTHLGRSEVSEFQDLNGHTPFVYNNAYEAMDQTENHSDDDDDDVDSSENNEHKVLDNFDMNMDNDDANDNYEEGMFVASVSLHQVEKLWNNVVFW